MEPVDLFYSYAHEDEPLRDELDGHLALLRRKGVIRPWHDRGIVPGQQWDKEIDAQLASADLILLLVSMDFLNSDYIWGKELATAIDRADRGEEPAGHGVVGLQGRCQGDPCGAFVLGERSARDHARLPSVCARQVRERRPNPRAHLLRMSPERRTLEGRQIPP